MKEEYDYGILTEKLDIRLTKKEKSSLRLMAEMEDLNQSDMARLLIREGMITRNLGPVGLITTIEEVRELHRKEIFR